MVDCGEEDEGGDGDIPGDEGERLSGRGRHPEHGLAIPLPGRIDVCDEGYGSFVGVGTLDSIAIEEPLPSMRMPTVALLQRCKSGISTMCSRQTRHEI